jgi:8-oxo-dGTP pyrophosphatase MutT (NUDIX family)
VIRLVAPSHTVGSLCLIEHDGRLLMLRQHHREGWTLPGGLVDRGEDAAQAAVREVLEETGLQVEVGLPIGVVVDPDTRRVDVLFHVPVDEAVTVRPRSEASRASWLAPQQAGPLDAPTSQAVAVLGRSRETGVYRGHLTRRPG